MYQNPKAFYDETAFNNGELIYHVKLKKGDIAKYVLLPSDPKSVGLIASYLSDAKLIADYREYVTVTGKYKGVPVSIVSTGMGGASAGIALEELIKVGSDTFIKIGTAIPLSPKVKADDLIIAQGAIKDDGTPSESIPHEYPAIANIDVVRALKKSAEALNYNHHIGVVHSTDCLYGVIEPQNSLFEDEIKAKLKLYTKAGALASDMESAALFSIASLRRVSLASLMNTTNDIYHVIKTALDAIVILEQSTKGDFNA